jgi:2-iminobutanoate/2-iminopropanoate deaminase
LIGLNLFHALGMRGSNDDRKEPAMKIHMIAGAPDAIGPYCHATQVGNLVFCSGQTPLDPETMEISGISVGEQTERALRNLEKILLDLGMSLQDVLKTTIYLTDMSHFDAMNEVYAHCFGAHTPARTTVAVHALPLKALVEIECIAQASEGGR